MAQTSTLQILTGKRNIPNATPHIVRIGISGLIASQPLSCAMSRQPLRSWALGDSYPNDLASQMPQHDQRVKLFEPDRRRRKDVNGYDTTSMIAQECASNNAPLRAFGSERKRMLILERPRNRSD
jgi:hypothetical protein